MKETRQQRRARERTDAKAATPARAQSAARARRLPGFSSTRACQTAPESRIPLHPGSTHAATGRTTPVTQFSLSSQAFRRTRACFRRVYRLSARALVAVKSRTSR